LPPGEWFCQACRCGDCGGSDSCREDFGPRTLVLCDRCDREFHVECLAARPDDDAQQLDRQPLGPWFCSQHCTQVAGALAAALHAGPVPLIGGYSTHALRGGIAPARILRAALAVIQECFHPIIDPRSGADLVPLIVNSQRTQQVDFSGFTTYALRYADTVLCVATVRLLGPKLAEMPLVGTTHGYRQQGLCRRLVRAIEETLHRLGITRLVLPAVPDIQPAWVGSFGFAPCTVEQRRELAHAGLLMFPGTSLLVKDLSEETFTRVPEGVPAPPHAMTRRAQAARFGPGDTPRGERLPVHWASEPDVSALPDDAEQGSATAAAAVPTEATMTSAKATMPVPTYDRVAQLIATHAALLAVPAAGGLASAPHTGRGQAKLFDATPDEPMLVVGHTRSQRTVRAPSHFVAAVREMVRSSGSGKKRSPGEQAHLYGGSPFPGDAVHDVIPGVDMYADLTLAGAHTPAGEFAIAGMDGAACLHPAEAVLGPLPSSTDADVVTARSALASARDTLVQVQRANADAQGDNDTLAASAQAVATASRRVANAAAVTAVRATERAQMAVSLLARVHELVAARGSRG